MNTIINGKRYPLWQKFVDSKQEWIGGTLESHEDEGIFTTIIKDITLEPNGDDSAAFSIQGEAFGCGGDVHYVGVDGCESGDGWLAFRGYGGHLWKIKKP